MSAADWQTVDRVAVDEVLSDSGIMTARPGPTVTGYLGALYRAALEWLAELVGAYPWLTIVWYVLLYSVLAAAAVMVVLLLLRGLNRLRRGRREPMQRTVSQPEEAAPPMTLDQLRGALERCLADGDYRLLLETVWRYLGQALGREHDDQSWTGRDLVSRSGRNELAQMIDSLEAATYGPQRRTREEIEQLCRRVVQAVATT